MPRRHTNLAMQGNLATMPIINEKKHPGKTERIFRQLPETPYHSLNARLFCIDDVNVRDWWWIRRHLHNCFELIVCWRGSYSCIVNKEPIDIAKGQALLVKQGDWHEDTSSSIGELIFIKFYLIGFSDVKGGALIFNSHAAASRFVFAYPHSMRRLIKAIEAINAEKKPIVALQQDSMTLTLFWTVCEQLPADAFSGEFASMLEANSFNMRLSNLFFRFAERQLPTRQIARELAMSVSTLERVCRRELGVTPAKAWASLRMEEALRLIRHSNMQIKEISENLGYSHQNHFANAFSRHYGKPPSYYRKRGEYPGVLHEEELSTRLECPS